MIRSVGPRAVCTDINMQIVEYTASEIAGSAGSVDDKQIMFLLTAGSTLEE
jgi:hypothetical protein